MPVQIPAFKNEVSTSKILYQPAIILEVLPSKAYAYIQSLVTKRILKYSFSYLKKIKDLNQLSRLSLPEDWQRLISDATRQRQIRISRRRSESENYLSSDENENVGHLGFGGSQEDLGGVSEETGDDI